MIEALTGERPHDSWGSWENFLAGCEVRDSFDGVIFYGAVNCNYIVFPDGTLLQNNGYHGCALMSEIRKHGVSVVLDGARQSRRELDAILTSGK